MEGKAIVDLTANVTQAQIVLLPSDMQPLRCRCVPSEVFVDVQQHSYTAVDVLLQVESEDPVLIGHTKVEAEYSMEISLLPRTKWRVALEEYHSSVVGVWATKRVLG